MTSERGRDLPGPLVTRWGGTRRHERNPRHGTHHVMGHDAPARREGLPCRYGTGGTSRRRQGSSSTSSRGRSWQSHLHAAVTSNATSGQFGAPGVGSKCSCGCRHRHDATCAHARPRDVRRVGCLVGWCSQPVRRASASASARRTIAPLRERSARLERRRGSMRDVSSVALPSTPARCRPPRGCVGAARAPASRASLRVALRKPNAAAARRGGAEPPVLGDVRGEDGERAPRQGEAGVGVQRAAEQLEVVRRRPATARRR